MEETSIHPYQTESGFFGSPFRFARPAGRVSGPGHLAIRSATSMQERAAPFPTAQCTSGGHRLFRPMPLATAFWRAGAF